MNKKKTDILVNRICVFLLCAALITSSLVFFSGCTKKDGDKKTESKPSSTTTTTTTSTATTTTPAITAEEYIKKYLTYKEVDGKIVITGYTGKDLNVYIPPKINGKNVTEIADFAFENMLIKSVNIPNTVKKIGKRAFACCNLEEIIIPNSVTSLGEGAFYRCIYAKKITIGSGLKRIEKETFKYCNGLRSDVVIPKNITYIADEAFKNAQTKEMIKIGYGDIYIGKEAFSGFRKAKGVKFGTGKIKIDEKAFYGLGADVKSFYNEYVGDYISITITIPYNVTSIGSQAFGGVEQLLIVGGEESEARRYAESENIIFISYGAYGGTIEEDDILDYNVFKDFTYEEIDGEIVITGYISKIVFTAIPSKIDGKNVTEIADNAFYGNYAVGEVNIPSTVKKIGKWAFSCCNNLKNIKIPNSVTSLGEGAFAYCNYAKHISLGKGITRIERSTFFGCSSLTGDLVIPDNITYIGESAFNSCSIDGKIIIGNGDIYIGQDAFNSCIYASGVTFGTGNIQIDEGAFEQVGLGTEYDEKVSQYIKVKEITIPKNVTSIGKNAFGGNQFLTILCHEDSEAERYAKSEGIKYNIIN